MARRDERVLAEDDLYWASAVVSSTAVAASPAEGAADSQADPADGTSDAMIDETLPLESNLPRWLRPTLREQRRSGERVPSVVAGQPSRFDAPAAAGIERRTIAYRLVRVTDQPDDIAANEVARLDRGDEVDVIGEHEGFFQVRMPSGLEGWVPRVIIVG